MAYTKEQRRMINLALQLSRGYGPRVRKSLLEAMAVESNFRNLNYGDRDSQGVLQQRPSTGWGPPGNAARDIQQYLERASRLAQQGFRGTAGQLAQAVQRSAFPARYDERRGEAAALLGSESPGQGAPIYSGGAAPVTSQGDQRSDFARALLDPRTSRDPLALLGAIKAVQAAAPSAAPAPQEEPTQPGLRVSGITYKGQKLTHDTDGLPGYPAVDLFAKPGTPFLAPEDGRIIRLSGRGGSSGNVYGMSVYFQGRSGRTYFITHLGTTGQVGRYRAGQPLGTVGKWKSGSPHAHVGVSGGRR